jgi:hypothetical protein
MNIRKILPLFCIVFVCASAGAQEKPELFSRTEQTFKEKEPAWKIERLYPGSTSDPLTESIAFRAGRQQAAIDISVWRRLKDAEEIFVGAAIAFDSIRGKHVVKRSIPNLGDENYMWTNPGSDAWPMIHFRQGNVYVTVYSPSVLIAKRFAHYVLEQINKTP